ncbi:MAG: MFS transporter [Gemmataceae bacterium]
MDEKQHSLARFLALNRTVGVVLVAVLCFGLGEQLWEPFMPIYFRAQNKSLASDAATAGVSWQVLWTVGLYAFLKNLLESFCFLGGGHLTARLGDRRSLLLFACLTLTGYLLFLTVPTTWGALLAAMLILGWEPLSVPVTFTTVGASVKSERRGMAFAVQSIQKRLPKILGPALAGIVLERASSWAATPEAGRVLGMQALVAIAFLLGIVSLLIQFRWMPHRDAPPVEVTLAEVWQALPGPLRRLLLAEIFKRWCDWLVRDFVVLYLVVIRGLSLEEAGFLIALQNLVALLTYLPIGRMTERVGVQPFIGLTFVFFALFPLLLAEVPTEWMAVAFVANGLREIGEPGRKALITSLMPEEIRARGIGMYWGVRTFAICWASLAAALVWWQHGPAVLLHGAFACGVVGTLVFYLFGPKDSRLEAT